MQKKTVICLLVTIIWIIACTTAAFSASTARTIRATMLKQTPSYKSKTIETLPANTFMAIESVEGAWVKVNTGYNVGYVAKNALSISPSPDKRPSFYAQIKGAQLLTWGSARGMLRGKMVTIIDSKTGMRFRAKNFVGTNHADMETMTKADTHVMKRMFGGQFSWQRRGVIVVINGQRYVASMNGMPHGSVRFIKNNGLNGVFCLHFIGSRTHNTNAVDADHQRAIMSAYRVV